MGSTTLHAASATPRANIGCIKSRALGVLAAPIAPNEGSMRCCAMPEHAEANRCKRLLDMRFTAAGNVTEVIMPRVSAGSLKCRGQRCNSTNHASTISTTSCAVQCAAQDSVAGHRAANKLTGGALLQSDKAAALSHAQATTWPVNGFAWRRHTTALTSTIVVSRSEGLRSKGEFPRELLKELLLTAF